MITNPELLKPKEKPYFHQISMDCLEKLVECIGRFNNGEIDADTSIVDHLSEEDLCRILLKMCRGNSTDAEDEKAMINTSVEEI